MALSRARHFFQKVLNKRMKRNSCELPPNGLFDQCSVENFFFFFLPSQVTSGPNHLTVWLYWRHLALAKPRVLKPRSTGE